MKRQKVFERIQLENSFDVVILGGGINGACLYDTLCRQNYKVLLADKWDFNNEFPKKCHGYFSVQNSRDGQLFTNRN